MPLAEGGEEAVILRRAGARGVDAVWDEESWRSEATGRRVVVLVRGGRVLGGSAWAVFSYRNATSVESSLKEPKRVGRDFERALEKIGGAI